ncbi:MAG: type II secretion system major pseudopilin GspG [Phycisphaeraceae bacterium]|nr:type II secretion system major pseudopilin GspG [Phycisphaeraceae bacterium]
MNHPPRTASFRPVTAGSRGFTLVEAIVVIIIIGVLATFIAPRLIGRVGQAKHATGEGKASVLATQMKLYLADCGKLPSSGATIAVLFDKPSDVDAAAWKGPYVDNRDALVDPWGKQFILRIPGQQNVDFDVVSYGADGKPGGEGEDADIIKP